MCSLGQKSLFEKELHPPVEPVFRQKGYRLIAGVDEVGRGALAGPVVTAAVILNPEDEIVGITDSKRLSPRKREKLCEEIGRRALAYSVDFIGHEEVDRLNVLEATRVSMRRAVAKLPIRPELILVDAVELGLVDPPSHSLVYGDALSQNIGAASIVAKVMRDKWMREAAERYPDYGFELNKGYGTQHHLECILMHGPCPLHRKTFKPVSGL